MFCKIDDIIRCVHDLHHSLPQAQKLVGALLAPLAKLRAFFVPHTTHIKDMMSEVMRE